MVDVYGPSSSDNPDFFYKISDHIDQFDNDLIISGTVFKYEQRCWELSKYS